MKIHNGNFIGEHKYCIASECEGREGCSSSDALSVFENTDDEREVYFTAHCYSCGQNFTKGEVHSSSHAEDLGINVEDGSIKEKKEFPLKVSSKEPITNKEAAELIKKVGYKANNYRSIKDEYCKFFGHLTELDSKGEVVARYYPETRDYKLVGYKKRHHPKKFYGPLGQTGIANDLSGQVKFKDYNNHRDILITGGEEDKAAAYQMLREYQIKKGQKDYAPVAVVSPTTGEGSAFKQIKAHYEFLDKFENIIIGMDNDEAGRAAAKKIVEVLPKGKCKIAYWSDKDPNEALKLGKERQWLSDYFGAVEVSENSIIKSSDLDKALIEGLNVDKIPLPEYMHKLQDVLAGGIPPRNKMVNVIGETKSGKSTHTNEMIYFWTFNSPELMGVMSLELAKDQYAIAIASRHLQRQLQSFKTKEEAMEYLEQEDIKNKLNYLWSNEFGEPRFYLLDERDFNIETTKNMCEVLYKKYGCGLIVKDPLHDLIGSLTNEKQEDFMSWQKQFKKDGPSLINVCHTNKSSSVNRGGPNATLRDLQDDDIQGTSAIAKSGDCNIFLMRDKYSKCPIWRNTTFVKVVCRWSAYSGPGGMWYYDPETHTSYDFDDYFNKYPEKLPPGFDRDVTPFDKKQDNRKKSNVISIPSSMPSSLESVDDFVKMDDGVEL